MAGRLGRSQTSTTLNHYGHWMPETDRAAAGVLSGLIKPEQGGVGWVDADATGTRYDTA